LPRIEAFENTLGFIIEVDILHITGLGVGECNDTVLKIYIAPAQTELLLPPHASQNGKPCPVPVSSQCGQQFGLFV
jgi:hypothetical protein